MSASSVERRPSRPADFYITQDRIETLTWRTAGIIKDMHRRDDVISTEPGIWLPDGLAFSKTMLHDYMSVRHDNIKKVRLVSQRDLGRTAIYTQASYPPQKTGDERRLKTTRLIATSSFGDPIFEPGFMTMDEEGMQDCMFDLFTVLNIIRADEGISRISY